MHIVLKCSSLSLLEPTGPVQACNGIALLLPFPLHNYQCPENLYGNDTINYNDKYVKK
jgi:hypothetical protein